MYGTDNTFEMKFLLVIRDTFSSDRILQIPKSNMTPDQEQALILMVQSPTESSINSFFALMK